MKKITSLVLLASVFLTLMGTTALSAATPKYTAEAQTLNSLGLFSGTGVDSKGDPVFELDRPATRIEAIVILIRLIGKQEEALNTTAANPFTDVPGWAEKYAAYAYENGISGGIGGKKFGSADKVTQNQFITFILRALGYSDKEGDFTYAKAYEKAAEIGLIQKGTFENNESVFLRDDCVKISFNALGTNRKDSEQRLIDSLVAAGSVSKLKAVRAGFEINELVTIKMTRNEKDRSYEASLSEIQKHVPNAAWVSYSMSAEDFASISDEELLSHCPAVLWYVKAGTTTSVVKDIRTMDNWKNQFTTIHNENGDVVAYGKWSINDKDTYKFKLVNYKLSELAAPIKKDMDEILKNYVDVPLDVLSIGIERHENIVGQEDRSWNKYYIKINESALPASVKKYKCFELVTIGNGGLMDIAFAGKYPMFKQYLFERSNTGVYASAPNVIDYHTMPDSYLAFYDEEMNLLGCIKFTSPAQTFEMPAVK